MSSPQKYRPAFAQKIGAEAGPTAITYFRDDMFFLSSMAPVKNGVITRDGRVVESAEIGYQADKFDDPKVRERILAVKDGFAAKKLVKRITKGEGIRERDGWDTEKLSVMRWYVWQKFGRNPREADLLAETVGREIIEGNERGADEWGACPRPEDGVLYGRNNLGLLIMSARDVLLDGYDLIDDAQRDVHVTNGEYRTWPTEL